MAKKTTTTKTLTLLDRVTLPSALPQKSDIKTMIIVNDIAKKVQLSQKELKDYEITALPNGAMGWNTKGANAKFPYTFTDLEEQTIKTSLKELDEKKDLTSDHIGLWNLFVK